ncbi:MAG: hypothetical protein RIM80_05910 [Alphaproteobacteria bacterium]
MSLPKPEPSLVIRYANLWKEEQRPGLEEGRKDRPCAVILTVRSSDDGEQVLVVPITHTPPKDPSLALEIPPTVKARLNLDDARSWIVYGEGNRFLWPGPDLRPIPGSHPPEFAYGFLPPKLFAVIKGRMIARIRARLFGTVARHE